MGIDPAILAAVSIAAFSARSPAKPASFFNKSTPVNTARPFSFRPSHSATLISNWPFDVRANGAVTVGRGLVARLLRL
jgi:hypothetical protein